MKHIMNNLDQHHTHIAGVLGAIIGATSRIETFNLEVIIITAIIGGTVGFITTTLCKYLLNKIKKRFKIKDLD